MNRMKYILLGCIAVTTISNASIRIMPPGCECLSGNIDSIHTCQEFDCKSSSMTTNNVQFSDYYPETLLEYIQYSLRSILSLKRDNSPVKGVFFKNPQISKTILNDESGFNRLQQQNTDVADERQSSSLQYTPPGYKFSQPIRAAKKVNDSLVESTIGFYPPTSRKDWNCDSDLEPFIVGFRDDILSSCILSLNVSGLEELCQSSSHDWWKQEHSFIGIFANADEKDIEQWIQTEKIASNSTSRIWQNDTKTCHGMISSLRYIFYWTYAGSVDNPQAKILHVTETVVDSENLIHSNEDVTQEQQFIFSSTIHWVYVKSEQDPLRLPPPKWIFAVPDDFFHPW